MNRILKNFVCTGTMLCDARKNIFEKSARVPSQFESKRSWLNQKTGSLNQNVSHARHCFAMHVPPQRAKCCREDEEFRFGNYHCTVACIRKREGAES
jgi:hypothetical protein